MVKRAENDFLNWTSFPSSIKIVNDEETHTTIVFAVNIPVTPGRLVKTEVKTKTMNVLPINNLGSWISLMGSPDGVNWRYIGPGFTVPAVPGVMGTKDWEAYKSEMVMPSDIRLLRCHFTCAKGTTWFDDLKLYQDNKLIYSNDFSKWDPVIGAGAGAAILGVAAAVIRVPEPGIAYEHQKPVLEKEPLLAAGLAGLGALVGGGIGLLSAMGLVPQIPIPTLEAPLEETAAQTPMGKYLVTG